MSKEQYDPIQGFLRFFHQVTASTQGIPALTPEAAIKKRDQDLWWEWDGSDVYKTKATVNTLYGALNEIDGTDMKGAYDFRFKDGDGPLGDITEDYDVNIRETGSSNDFNKTISFTPKYRVEELYPDGLIYFDSVNGVGGQDLGIGTKGNPSNNLNDAGAIATAVKIRRIRLSGFAVGDVSTGTNLNGKILIGAVGDAGEPQAEFSFSDSGDDRSTDQTVFINLLLAGDQGNNIGKVRLIKDCSFRGGCNLKVAGDRFLNCQSYSNGLITNTFTVQSSTSEDILLKDCNFKELTIIQTDAFQGNGLVIDNPKGHIKLNFSATVSANAFTVIKGGTAKIEVLESISNIIFEAPGGVLTFDSGITDAAKTFTINAGTYRLEDNSPALVVVVENKTDNAVLAAAGLSKLDYIDYFNKEVTSRTGGEPKQYKIGTGPNVKNIDVDYAVIGSENKADKETVL